MLLPRILSSHGAAPLNRATYDKVSRDILNIFNRCTSGLQPSLISTVRSEDVIHHVNIISVEFSDRVWNDVCKEFRTYASGGPSNNMYIHNERSPTGIRSMVWRGYHINFIPCNSSLYEFTRMIYSHGCVGILLKRLYKSMGLDLTVGGLAINIEGTSENVLLSLDYSDICKGLGISPDAFRYDLMDKASVYDRIIASPYYSKEALLAVTEAEAAEQVGYSLLEGLPAYLEGHATLVATNAVAVHNTFVGGFPKETLLRFILRFFGVTNSFKMAVKKVRTRGTRNKEFREGGIHRWVKDGLGKDLSAPDLVGFTNYFKTRHLDLTGWLESKSDAEVIADVSEKYAEWRLAMDS